MFLEKNMNLKRSIFSTEPIEQGLLVQYNGTGVYNPTPPKIPKHGEPVRFPRSSSHRNNFKPGFQHDTTSKIPAPSTMPVHTPVPMPKPVSAPAPHPAPAPTTPAPPPPPATGPAPSIPTGGDWGALPPTDMDVDIFEGLVPGELPQTTPTITTPDSQDTTDVSVLEKTKAISSQISTFIFATQAVDWTLLNIGGKNDTFGVQAIYKAYKAKGLTYMKQFEDALPPNRYLKFFNEFNEFKPTINDDVANTMTRVGAQMETTLDTAEELSRAAGLPDSVQTTLKMLQEKLRKGLASLKNMPTFQNKYLPLIDAAEDFTTLESFALDYETGAQQIVDDFDSLEVSMDKVAVSVENTRIELEANGTLKDASKIEETIVLKVKQTNPYAADYESLETQHPQNNPDLEEPSGRNTTTTTNPADDGRVKIDTETIPTDPDYKPATNTIDDVPDYKPATNTIDDVPTGRPSTASTTTVVDVNADLDEVRVLVGDAPEYEHLRARTNSIETLVNEGDQNVLSLADEAKVKAEVALLKSDIEELPKTAAVLTRFKAFKTKVFSSKIFKVTMSALKFIGFAGDAAQVIMTVIQIVDLVVENEEKRVRPLYPDDYEGTPADIYNKDADTFINLQNMISRVSTAFREGSSISSYATVEPYVRAMEHLKNYNFYSPQPVPYTTYPMTTRDGKRVRTVKRPSDAEVYPRRDFNRDLAAYLIESQDVLRTLLTYLSQNTKNPVKENVESSLRTFPNLTQEQLLIKATGIPELWTTQFQFILGHVENPSSTNIEGLITQDAGSNIAGGVDYSGLWNIGLDIIGLGGVPDQYEEAHRYMQPEYYPFTASSIWVRDHIVYENLKISAGVLVQALTAYMDNPTPSMFISFLVPIKAQLGAVENMYYDVPEKRFFEPSQNNLSLFYATQNMEVNKAISQFLLMNVETPIITLAAYISNQTNNVELRTHLDQIIKTPRVPDWITLTTDTMLKSRIQNWGSLFNFLVQALDVIKTPGGIPDTAGTAVEQTAPIFVKTVIPDDVTDSQVIPPEQTAPIFATQVIPD
jgi:hypothetical protein